MGGALSKPSEHFPNVFGGTFWKEYPYFLPCLVSASFVLFTFTVLLIVFKEASCSVFVLLMPYLVLLDRAEKDSPRCLGRHIVVPAPGRACPSSATPHFPSHNLRCKLHVPRISEHLSQFSHTVVLCDASRYRWSGVRSGNNRIHHRILWCLHGWFPGVVLR